MKAWGITDKGRLRQLNEDFIYVGDKIFIVADGMGGHQAGEIASKMAVEQIKEYLYQQLNHTEDEEQIIDLIKEAIKHSNDSIRRYSLEHEQCEGMGTTVVICMMHLNKAFIANIGDSRAYLIRNKEMVQITRDHSLINEMIERGQLSKEQAKNHPQKNYITRALGTDDTVEIDFYKVDIQGEDMLLLCTDGLSGVLEDEAILDLIIHTNDREKMAEALVNKANELGGPDNISIIIIYESNK